MLDSFIGKIREDHFHVIEVLDGVFLQIFQKVAQVGVPQSNISEVDKIRINAIKKFYQLYLKALEQQA